MEGGALMPRRMKCRHPHSVLTWGPHAASGDPPFARHCATPGCGAVLSLGPANDRPREVQIEIRAVAAAMADSANDGELHGRLGIIYESQRTADPDGRDEEEPAPSRFMAWPADQPPRYNGCGEPCDMWIGPCLCGATHTAEQRSAGGAP